jgi:aarF domain-containing kinase
MQEMDYELEAYNMITFKRDMEPLKNIVVADVHPEFTRRRVIVTSWIDGVKLSDCSSADVIELCDSLLNCYLIQLLDTGFLHADPHPGNLLRTTDGKLCILDFGLMSEVEKDQRIHIVEFIAHLSLEDFSAVTKDLVSLGFLPGDVTDAELDVISPVIKEVWHLYLCTLSTIILYGPCQSGAGFRCRMLCWHSGVWASSRGRCQYMLSRGQDNQQP